MKNIPKVFIVILNWNRPEETLECLESVYQVNYENYEVVIVDNGSDGGSCEKIKEKYPGITLIKNLHNVGYARGNNAGMRWSMERGADYIWLLNDDTTVSSDCLKLMVDAGEADSEIGLVSPIVYFFEDPLKWQFVGTYMDWERLSLKYPERGREISEEFQRGRNVCLWGTALLIKRRVIEETGYLKDEYFAYWEDTEYSLRSIRAGFRNMVCQSARIFHKGQLTEGNVSPKGEHFYYFMQRNRILLGNEYIDSSLGRLRFRIEYFGELTDFLRRCEKKYLDSCMDGAWQGIKGITGPMSNGIKMPKYFKILLLFISRFHLAVLADLLTLNMREISRRVLKRI